MIHFSVKTNPADASDTERRLRILLIEDNEDQRRSLAALLQRRITDRITLAQVEIVATATLAEGLLLADTANCTVIDLDLPDSEPAQTISAIRKFRPPVIVTTGDDSKQTETDCIAAGAESVFVKGDMLALEGDNDKNKDLCRAVVQCLMKDLLRLNGVLTPHGDVTK